MALIDRWVTLWEVMGFPDPESHFTHLVTQYQDGKKVYHAMVHVQHCLEEFDKVKHLLEDPIAAELALWFHNEIYDPKRPDNEELSAEAAIRCLVSCGASPTLILKVVAHILATKQHRVITNDPDQPFVLDIDMAILGQPKTVFDRYDNQIALEFGFVPREKYCEGRTAALRGFERPIFKTPFFHDLYEEVAEENIQRAITRLS